MSGSDPKASDAKVLKTEPLMIKDARWTKLVFTLLLATATYYMVVVLYVDVARAQTRPEGSGIDGVGIVAILQKASGPELLLQKQFRPPINKVVIEIPAGLVDKGETAGETAVRELKEETGYHGVTSEISPVMFNGLYYVRTRHEKECAENTIYPDPGFCNTNLNMVHVNVDMSLAENQNLKPELEENEFIEVFSLPLKGLYVECKRLEEEGYAIDARVGTLAEGIEIARRWKL